MNYAVAWLTLNHDKAGCQESKPAAFSWPSYLPSFLYVEFPREVYAVQIHSLYRFLIIHRH